MPIGHNQDKSPFTHYQSTQRAKGCQVHGHFTGCPHINRYCLDSLSKSKRVLHSTEHKETYIADQQQKPNSEHSYTSQEHKRAIQFWNRGLLLGVHANNYINLSIKSLSREILGLVCAARTTYLSIAKSERAGIVLAV